MCHCLVRQLTVSLAVVGTASSSAHAQTYELAKPGTVLSEDRIAEGEGGFEEDLTGDAHFGSGAASLGDVDGDGVGDVAVGARGMPPVNTGVVYVIFLHADETVKSSVRISEGEGGFTGELGDEDEFGTDVSNLGDLDGNGVDDLGVGTAAEAVWILYLEEDGTVSGQRRIAPGEAGFQGPPVGSATEFGTSICGLGDLNGDGARDIAVGAPDDDDGSGNTGAVWVLFLDEDQLVVGEQKISATAGGWQPDLTPGVRFGSGLDFSSEFPVPEGLLAVGAVGGSGGLSRGELWLLSLAADGRPRDHVQIDNEALGTVLGDDDFGNDVEFLDDLDGNGFPDVAVGAPHSDDVQQDAGSLWFLFLGPDGSLLDQWKVSLASGNLQQPDPDFFDNFGWSVTGLGDLDGNGFEDVAVGAIFDDNAPGFQVGAVYLLHLTDKLPAVAENILCGGAAPASSMVVSELLNLGTTAVFSIQNLWGTQDAGSLPFVLLSFSELVGDPCGLVIPNTGIVFPGQNGVLLVDLGPPQLPVLAGEPWSGVGSADVELDVPASTALIGLVLYAQGVLFDPVGASGVSLGLAAAKRTRIGCIE